MEALGALTRRRPSKPSGADARLARRVGRQIWDKVLKIHKRKRSIKNTRNKKGWLVPLDLAKVDELLKSCSPDVFPLETTAFHLRGVGVLGFDAKQQKGMKALRFSSGAADREPSFVAEIDLFESEQRRGTTNGRDDSFSDSSDSDSSDSNSYDYQTLVEWLCGNFAGTASLGEDYAVDGDWVFETLRVLMERGAMVTENALAAAEEVTSDIELKAKLLIYMLSQCPAIITKTRRNLDYYAKIVEETDELTMEHYIADTVLFGLVGSPDVFDAFAAYPRGSPEKEAARQRLIKLLISNAALRPPPIEPREGTTHTAGGHFSRWHEKHVKFMTKELQELKDEAVAEIAALKSECERVSAELARVQGRPEEKKASLKLALSRSDAQVRALESENSSLKAEIARVQGQADASLREKASLERRFVTAHASDCGTCGQIMASRTSQAVLTAHVDKTRP